MHSAPAIEGASTAVTTVSIRERFERALHRALFAALVATLIFGPLALGIVQDWSTAVLELAAAALLPLWLAWRLVATPARPIRWSPLFPPMLLILCVAIIQILFHRTAYLNDTLSELWLCLAYGILAFVAAQLLRHAYLLLFAKCAALFASLYAVFAVLQGLTSNGRIYWLIKPHAGSVYGSYVNHNHYAGFMELLLPIALVLALEPALRREKRFLLAFSTIVMAASIFLSQSRGGMIALIAEMLFLGLIWMIQFSPTKSAIIFFVFCLATALALVRIAPQQIASRIADFSDPARLQIHRDSFRMFAAHPFLGSGLGTFPTVFPHYRVFYDGFIVNHAHDDYLELLLDAGSLGFAAAVWFLVALYRNGLRNLRLAKVSSSARIAAAALAGCTGLLVHSFLDFNLHIPANAAWFYVLCILASSPLSHNKA